MDGLLGVAGIIIHSYYGSLPPIPQRGIIPSFMVPSTGFILGSFPHSLRLAPVSSTSSPLCSATPSPVPPAAAPAALQHSPATTAAANAAGWCLRPGAPAQGPIGALGILPQKYGIKHDKTAIWHDFTKRDEIQPRNMVI